MISPLDRVDRRDLHRVASRLEVVFIPNPTRPPFPGGPIRGRREFNQNQSRDEHRLNERIRVPEVRLIDEKGEQVGVVPTQEALRMARERSLDLMEVSPNAQPPVCKICDYGKFKYEKKKKEQVAKKKQVVIKIKEVQLRPNIEEHDLAYKIKACRTFIGEGDKAKLTMIYRGREVTHAEGGMLVMKRVIEELKDISTVESPPKMEGKKLILILAPAKKSA